MDNTATPTVLALDIGGTKTLVALVRNGRVLDERTAVTNSAASASDWIDCAASLAADWRGQYALVSAAVTGLVDQGLWNPLNPKTLHIPANFPLTAALAEKFDCAATAMNDAQAAAWGEYRYGAGQGKDMVFLTISTGVGGGAVINGRLLQGRHGLAGHFGITQIESLASRDPVLLEDSFSGHWMATQAALQGHADADARLVFSKAREGVPWAAALVNTSVQRMAMLCANIQLMFSPCSIVVGGGIGLASAYLAQVQERLACLPEQLRPQLYAALLGTHAGVIGASDFATHHQPQRGIP